jgi:hypothetical protein
LNPVYEEIAEDAPAVQYVGAYIARVTARCLKCSYETDWATFRKNNLCDGRKTVDLIHRIALTIVRI